MQQNPLYFIVSLPRTGTKSICKMAEMCGLTSMHVLSSSKTLIQHIGCGYNFFADTPFYNPHFLTSFLETQNGNEVKFIYLDRDKESWSNSFERLWKGWVDKPHVEKISKNKIDFLDNINYEYLNSTNRENRFKLHKHCINEIARLYRVETLNYWFDDGWEPFCSFTKTIIPQQKVPKIK